MSADDVKIVVRHGFLVNHDGRSYTAADGPVEIPEALADEWISNGWAIDAPTPRSKR